MKEMVGGCCVCSDERGFYENPLVYCDGQGCNVAVHQACYGIVSVPTGPWFCRKCESQERLARVKCELCPSKDGALKRTDNSNWAHVVCALYIPEVRFGNNNTMEPIILQLVPPERYSRTCSLCEEQGKEAKSKIGACMQCNKQGCRQYFHVTCAQAAGLLCEEAGNNTDNVKYCGYCSHHYQKLKKDGGNIKPIPAFKPIPNDNVTPESSPEKFSPSRPPLLHSTVNEMKHPKKKTMKTGSISSNASMASPSSIHSNSNHGIQPSFKYELKLKSENISEDIITSTKTIQSSVDPSIERPVIDSTIKKKKKSIASSSSASPPTVPQMSPLSSNLMPTESKPQNPSLFASIFSASLHPSNTPSNTTSNTTEKVTQMPKPSVDAIQSSPKRIKSDSSIEKKKLKKPNTNPNPNPMANISLPIKTKSAAKDYSDLKELPVKKVRKRKFEITSEELTNGVLNAVNPVCVNPDFDHNYHRSIPVNHPNMTPLQNGYSNSEDKSSSVVNTSSQLSFSRCKDSLFSAERPPKLKPKFGDQNECEVPQTLEQLLERQWAQGSQFVIDQAQHFDISSLLSCLHQLRSENNRLEERVRDLMARRDQLLAVNARLTLPANNVFPINGALSSLNSNNIGLTNRSSSPVSAHSALSAASSPQTHNNSPSDFQNKSLRVSSPAQASSPTTGGRSHPMTNFQANNEANSLTPQQNSSQIYPTLTQNISSTIMNASNASPSPPPSQSHSHSYYNYSNHQQNSTYIRKSNGSDKR